MTGETDPTVNFRIRLRDAVAHLPAPVRHRLTNSFSGFERARTLLPVDREMASFRAITAGEEAAAALFRSLQLRGYPGSESLSLKLHQHKAALGPFIHAVRHQLFGQHHIEATMTLTVQPPMLTVALPVSQFVPGADKFMLQLEHPLDWISAESDGSLSANRFADAMDKVAGDRSVDRLITAEANARNRLLYAHDGGLPVSKATAQDINHRELQAELMAFLCIAVLQTDQQQRLAQHSLDAFLQIVRRSRVDIIT